MHFQRSLPLSPLSLPPGDAIRAEKKKLSLPFMAGAKNRRVPDWKSLSPPPPFPQLARCLLSEGGSHREIDEKRRRKGLLV